jgi:hypothetical protein
MRLSVSASISVILLPALVATASAQDLNSYRAQHGRAALRTDASLTGLAYLHARSMASRNSLDHAGFKTERFRQGANAENVSFGCSDQACAIRQWANSAPHRANMLRKDVTTYGIASAVAANGRQYWVMELGGAPPVVRVVVRGGGSKQYMQTAAPRRKGSVSAATSTKD